MSLSLLARLIFQREVFSELEMETAIAFLSRVHDIQATPILVHSVSKEMLFQSSWNDRRRS